MKTSQFFLGFILSFIVILGLYGAIKDKADWLVIGSGVFLALLTITYVFSDLNNYGKYLKGKRLEVFDVKIVAFLRTVLVFTLVGLWIYLGAKFDFHFGITALGILLTMFLGAIYATEVPMAGLYKDGKYLGAVHNANIQVSDKLFLGKTKNIEHVGKLKIIRNGEELARIAITAEGLMELTPDKISELFPEIKGKVEKFGGRFFKVGDYTLDYEIGFEYETAVSNEDETKRGTEDRHYNKDKFISPVYDIYVNNAWYKMK